MERGGIFGFIVRRRLILAAILALAVFAALRISGSPEFYKRHAQFGEPCRQIHEDTGAVAQCVSLYFATTRNLRGESEGIVNAFRTVTGFGNRFANDLTYGRAEVSLPYLVSEDYPEGRKRGVVEHAEDAPPSTKEETQNLVSLTSISKAGTTTEFYSQLSEAVGENNDSLLLFIHGFNVDFDSAVVRTAQLAVDLTYSRRIDPNEEYYEFGQPVLFSWPNGGVPFTYLDDRRLAKKSAAHLTRFLDDLTKRSGASSINIIVHSMGNRVLVGALTDFVQTYSSDQAGDIEFKIIHAAADVDQEVYDAAMDKIEKSAFKAEYTVYASAQDTPLRTSRIINWLRSGLQQTRGRLGEVIGGDIYIRSTDDDVERQRFTSIDATGFATDLYGHGYFSNAGNIIADISCLLEGRPPNERALAPRTSAAGEYWEADSSKCTQCAISRAARTAVDPVAYLNSLASPVYRAAPGGIIADALREGLTEGLVDDPDYDAPPVEYKDCWDGSDVPISAECPPQIFEEQAAELQPLAFTIYFDYKKANLTAEAMTLIEEAAALALQNDIEDIVISGNTDTAGPEAYNRNLSELRARAVRDALIASGAPADRIRIEALGETNPAKSTDDDTREPLNRRAEVVISFN